jgi:energy-coupling factor transporter ATP-binding protein EcfA2
MTLFSWQEIQLLTLKAKVLRQCRNYLNWLVRNDIFMPVIEVPMARLLSVGAIAADEIFVYSRAIEDIVNIVLTRSKRAAELASMATSLDQLDQLEALWGSLAERRLVACKRVGIDGEGLHMGAGSTDLASVESGVTVNYLSYSRGTTKVTTRGLHLHTGRVYCVTGANGSGKSTLFSLLMACRTNHVPVDVHPSIRWELEPDHVGASDSLAGQIQRSRGLVPRGGIDIRTGDVVEVTQGLYWPMHISPLEFFFSQSLEQMGASLVQSRLGLLSTWMERLMFHKAGQTGSDAAPGNGGIAEHLTMVKKQWFDELSGGQRVKAELIRKVFLRDRCPGLLLLDEAFQPLDPASREVVMHLIRTTCHSSVVLVIYHTDAKSACIPRLSVKGTDFWDANIHFEEGVAKLRSLC